MTPALPSPKPRLVTGEKVCWWFVLIGGAMVAAPFLAPDYFSGWNGGQYAMALVGLLIAPTAFISSFLFRRRRLVRDALFDPTKALLRWTYDPAEWRSYTEEDFVRERKAKWALFGVVAFFCVLIGGFFFAMDPEEGGPWVLGVLLGLCGVIAGVILLTTSLQRKHRLAGAGEVRIGEDGLWLSGELHVWHGFGAKLEGCDVVAGRPPCIEFMYSTPAKNQRQVNSVRVPIPAGFDAEAAGLVAHFREKLTAPS